MRIGFVLVAALALSGCASMPCWPGLSAEEVAAIRAMQPTYARTGAMNPTTPAEHTAARYIGVCGMLDPVTAEVRR